MATHFEKYALIAALIIILVSIAGNFGPSGFASGEPCNKVLVKEVGLGENLTSEFSDEISRNDLCLFKGSVNLQGDESETREVLVFGQKGRFIGPATALTSGQTYDDAVLEVNENSIKFYYIFDNSIDLTKVSIDNPVDVKFLGKDWKITSVSDTEFTAIVGDTLLVAIGDSIIQGNKTVQLLRVGSSGAIVVDVSGVSGVLSRGQTKNINGLEITNQDSFYDSSNLFDNFADLVVGAKTLIRATAGQPYPGQNYSGWVWNIGGLASGTGTLTSSTSEFSGPYIGIENNFEYNSEDSQLGSGSCIYLPENYTKICFDKLIDKEYTSLVIGVETADLSAAGGGSSETTTHFEASGDGLRVNGVRTKEVWVTGNNQIYYEKNGVKSAGSGADIGAIEDLKITQAGNVFTIASPRPADELMFSFSGSSLSTATWNEINLIDRDGKLITRQGVIVKAGNRLKLLVPDNWVKAIVNITSSSN